MKEDVFNARLKDKCTKSSLNLSWYMTTIPSGIIKQFIQREGVCGSEKEPKDLTNLYPTVGFKRSVAKLMNDPRGKKLKFKKLQIGYTRTSAPVLSIIFSLMFTASTSH